MNIIWIILSFLLGLVLSAALCLLVVSIGYLKHIEREEKEDDERAG